MKIQFGDKVYVCSDRFSQKDFTHASLSGERLDGLVVYASCFSHEEPDAEVFPPDMSGVTFLNCNLDNVKIPDGNLVLGGSQRRIKVQNDLRDWEVDANGLPLRVTNEKYWNQIGISVDPRDMPAQKLRSPEEALLVLKKAGG